MGEQAGRDNRFAVAQMPAGVGIAEEGPRAVAQKKQRKQGHDSECQRQVWSQPYKEVATAPRLRRARLRRDDRKRLARHQTNKH